MAHSTFASYMNHASSEWANADISHYGVDEIIYVDIVIIGGNLDGVRKFMGNFPSNDSGHTLPITIYEGEWTYYNWPFTYTKYGYQLDLGARILLRTDFDFSS